MRVGASAREVGAPAQPFNYRSCTSSHIPCCSRNTSPPSQDFADHRSPQFSHDLRGKGFVALGIGLCHVGAGVAQQNLGGFEPLLFPN